MKPRPKRRFQGGGPNIPTASVPNASDLDYIFLQQIDPGLAQRVGNTPGLWPQIRPWVSERRRLGLNTPPASATTTAAMPGVATAALPGALGSLGQQISAAKAAGTLKPVSLANTLASALGGAAQGAQGSKPWASALGGGVGAMALNWLLRRGAQPGGFTHYSQGRVFTPPDSTAAPSTPATFPPPPDLSQPGQTAMNTVNPNDTGQYMTGLDRLGNNIYSNDGGKTWQTMNTNRSVTGPVSQPSVIGGAPASAPLDTSLSDSDLYALGSDFACGGPVSKKKARGGVIRRVPPRKPAAVPPVEGPKNGQEKFEDRAHRVPHVLPIFSTTIIIAKKKPAPKKKAKGGAVRGRGAEQRGKGFSGIF